MFFKIFKKLFNVFASFSKFSKVLKAVRKCGHKTSKCTVLRIICFAKCFDVFAKFSKVFRSFRTHSDLFGPIRIYLDAFGHTGTPSEAFGCFSKKLQIFRILRVFGYLGMFFDVFGKWRDWSTRDCMGIGDMTVRVSTVFLPVTVAIICLCNIPIAEND